MAKSLSSVDTAWFRMEKPTNLEAEPVAPAEEVASPAAGPVACQALTKAGLPCKNAALPGSRYCRVHHRGQYLRHRPVGRKHLALTPNQCLIPAPRSVYLGRGRCICAAVGVSAPQSVHVC